MLAGWQPVAFGGRVDLEDVSSGAEDGLLPGKRQREGVCLTPSLHIPPIYPTDKEGSGDVTNIHMHVITSVDLS